MLGIFFKATGYGNLLLPGRICITLLEEVYKLMILIYLYKRGLRNCHGNKRPV